MSEAALAPTDDETASPNSGESRWTGFDVHVGTENATLSYKADMTYVTWLRHYMVQGIGMA
jgi:hypothetical protein